MKFKMRRSVALALVALAAVAGSSRVSAQVVINEIHYNPPGTDGTVLLEYIELHNRGAAAADVSNWRLVFGALPYVFPAAVSIPAGGRVVVAESPASLQGATGFLTSYSWAGLGVGLDNGGETITLQNAASVDQDVVTYDDVAPWPAGSGAGQPDDGGSSIELLNPNLDNNVGGSWRASTVVNGTPGAQNSVFSNAPTVQNEVPARRTAVASLATVSVTFNISVSGVTAGSLTVGGSPATSLSCPSCVAGEGAGPYTFSGYGVPAAGSTAIALNGAGILAGAVPFGGDSWTVSTGISAVINELHYHPFDVDADAEFLEIYNAGSLAIDMSGWKFTTGLTGTVPPGTIVAAGGYVVFAKIPALVQARTGYAGSIAWTSGSLSNGGEPIAVSDAADNVIDSVTYGDSGTWPKPPDGSGPSLELINPALPNQYGGAWRSSLASWGTPGAANSTYVAAPPPIINDPKHTPILPLPNQAVTVTALILDDGVAPPTATLYYRQDFNPTIAYSSTPMLDDGLHGDGAAGDQVFGATMPGLPDGERLDFTIRADDGTSVSAGPPGHNTLVTGENPTQTYLCKFSNAPTTTDMPHYHLITTQRTRTLQDAHDENEYDGTFVQCTAGSTGCQLFYNVVERYRGQSSLNQHPHGYRINFPASNPLPSEMGFPVQKLNLMSQQTDKQALGYQFFRVAFSNYTPGQVTQFVRFLTSPLSHGGIQDFAYINVEKEDADFLESQGGVITPLRFPGMCTVSLATCAEDADCGVGGGTCFDRTEGNIYKGVLSADLQYLGTDPNSYRAAYEKETNETDDVWTDIINLTNVLDPDTTPDAGYEAAVNAIADENNWARYFAMHMLLVNQEGGIYRDTGDDFLLYFEPPGSPLGYNTKFIPRDMDSVFGGFGAFNQETIWRTNVQTTQRFVRHNAYAGRFVGAICELLNSDFTQPVMDARIDALPTAIADAGRKAQLKAWVAARIVFVNNEITRTTTLTGVPASPYQSANPTIALSGQLNQCGTYRALLNGAPVANYSIFNHTWSGSFTLVPGPNHIVVQSVDVNGAVLDEATADVVYAPPGVAQSSLRLTMPSRMLNPYTLSLKAEVLDSLGRIDWRTCDQLGTVTATRVSDNSPVATSVTVFDPHLAVPADSIRFYNGIGSVSITLDAGAAEPAGDIRVTVTLGTLSATKIVTIVSGPTFRSMSGTLAGADLTWGPDETIRITGATTVPSGSVLTINPGTLVLVNTTGGIENGTLITVNGSISAVGTSANPIHFFSERNQLAMALTQSGSASNGDAWRGFELRGSGSSTMKWVFLTGAGNGVVTGHPRPPIIHMFDTHNLLAEDSSYLDNNGMIFSAAGTGTYTVRRALISRCGIGGEFNGNGHTLLIEDSWWTSCGWAPEPLTLDGDLLHIDGSASNQLIRSSIFADSGDDGIDHSGSNFTVENIIIRGILDKAISMTGGSVTMHNSLIFSSGSAIRGLGRVYNTTIATGVVDTPQIIQESILWTGSNDSCAGDIDYNILGNPAHTTCGIGNISVNPQFQGSCNFNPQAGSPALTAGPTGGRIGWLGFPTATTCLVDSECNDGNACSIDTCQLGVCTFTPIVGCTTCTTAADCNDNNACTVDTCGALGTCQASQPVSCDDANACTTDTCDTLLGCQHSAANCDDSNVCTDDSCVGGACQHVNNTASCSDGNLCTTSDVCAAGACGGTPVSCPGGQTCNPGTGVCQAGPTVVSFQQGASGYSGSADTFIDAALGSQAGVSPIVVDGSPVEQVLLRFDGIFGVGPGQIPPGSTISSASLTLWVGTGTNDQSANAVNLHRLLHAWSDTGVWAAYGAAPWNAQGGIQNDGVDALAAIEATATMPTAATSSQLEVTTSLQAWSTDPASSFGWAILPTGTDGLRLESAESVTASNTRRPLLTVTFNPPATGCTIAADCDDGNVCTDDSCNVGTCAHVDNTASCADALFCNGLETCAGGSCQSGTVVDCDDGVACTGDSCNETTDACEHSLCAMTVTAAGSRWLDVTPPAGLPSVALKVSAAGLGCLPKYVDANGALTSSPVFQSSVDWGTTHVGDRAIVPATGYTVEAEVTPGTPIGSGTATTWAWGDANNNGGVSVFDIVCALDGFQGIFTHCTPYGADQNGGALAHPVTIDINDVMAVLDAFSGNAYPDATPCAALFFGGAPPTRKPDAVEPKGQLTLVPSATTVSRFGTVRIDVYGDGLTDIRAYQVALEANGGTTGALIPAEASVDAGRSDRLFHGRSAFPVADAKGIRLGATTWRDAVTSTDRVFLGSFVFRADGEATGTFHVGFRKTETLLWGSASTSVEPDTSPGVDITVTGQAR